MFLNSRKWYAEIGLLAMICFIGTLWGIEVLEDKSMLPGILAGSNMVKYGFALVVFVAAFLLGHIVVSCLPRIHTCGSLLDHSMSPKTYYGVFAFLFLCVCAALLHRRFVGEMNDFGVAISTVTVHQIPAFWGILLLLLAGAGAVGLSRKNRDIPAAAEMILYILILGLCFISGLVLNIGNADVFHGVAYLETVYNVYHGVPYTLETTGIYGHYGLFFAPFLHLFGAGNNVVMCLIAAIRCSTVLLCLYCICSLCKTRWKRIVVLLACCISLLSMRWKNYWQVNPHRELFAMIIAAYVIYIWKHDRWTVKAYLKGIALCILAVLWNTETGLFAVLAFSAAWIVHDLQSELWYSKRMLKWYAVHVFSWIASVAAAIVIMNLYNFLCGHDQIELSVFFFPLFEKTYMDGILRYDIMPENDAWIYILAEFAMALLTGVYYTTLFHTKEEVKAKKQAHFAPVLVVLSVLGLLNFSYYMNRAAYNCMTIIIYPACITVCALWGVFSENWWETDAFTGKTLLKKLISLMGLAAVAALAIQALVFSPAMIRKKYEAGHYDAKTVMSACEEIQAAIPENTFAVGSHISVLYNTLGWDTVGHYRDHSDWLIDGSVVIDRIADDILQQNAFVIYSTIDSDGDVRCQSLMDRLLELEYDKTYRLEKQMIIDGRMLHYYTKTGTDAAIKK